jgi:hypothetical protein
MKPFKAYTDKKHAQQDHDYYQSLMIDRMSDNPSFYGNELSKNQAKTIILRLTDKTYQHASVADKLTVSQVLFLLDHVMNHADRPNREEAAADFYQELCKLPLEGTFDLNPLLKTLAKHLHDTLLSQSKNRGI